jgi:hypothetical protein
MASKSKDPTTFIEGAGPGIACLAASSPENTPTILAAQASLDASLDAIECALRGVVVHALRKRAAAQRQRATDGTLPADAHSCAVTLRSPEAALAARLAVGLQAIADELEAEGAR